MAYTPTVYTNDASSPDLNATNLNKSEQGIKLAHDIAVPVDCTSRVAEYTGDGIPLIPDNVAGTTYRSNFATTDGWETATGTLSVSNGKLKFVASAVSCNFVKETITRLANGQHLVMKVTSLIDSNMSIRAGTYANAMKIIAVKAGVPILVPISTTGITSTTALWISFNTQVTVELDTIYIGTGAYDTPALDRSGNGNSLALTAVTPVNGKYGKEMSFNGFTSFGVDKSPIVGTSGTLIMRWKRNRVGTAETLISNQSATTDGLRYHIDASNNLYAIIGGSSPVSILIKSGFTDTTSSHVFGIKFSASSATPFYDGVDGSAVSATQVLGLANLAIGRNQIDSTGYASGQGCFRADSRIWTADEARAWSLNPISIDSRV